MSLFERRFPRFALTCVAAVVGWWVGLLVYRAWQDRARANQAEAYQVFPLPHHVPKYPGGVSFRFAMAHDVIHERFPRHGRAYYEERNRRVRQALQDEQAKRQDGGKPAAERFVLLDDLAVGLDLLGKHQEAIDLMRAKLKEQETLGLAGRDLYSSYANLGTFLILWQIQEGFADVPTARQRLTEGLGHVRKSIEVNPQSHFGREIWQAVILEYLLAVLDDPKLVLRFDMVGNRLDVPMQNIAANRSLQNSGMWNLYARGARADLADEIRIDADSRQRRRSLITPVGAEAGWTEAVKSAHQKPVPFDEPCLGIIGMWRLGGGANPHFALALGEIMMRVGQRYIAWCAYERAGQMAQFVGPPAIAEKFAAHCRSRQMTIREELPPAEQSPLRPRFDKELAFGKRYQQAYQDYEAQRIRAGASIDDPHFYDAFQTEHGPIASPSGPEEEYRVQRDGFSLARAAESLAAMLLGAGLAAFLVAIVVRLLARPRSTPAESVFSPPV